MSNPYQILFAIKFDYFVFLSLFSLCSFIVVFIVLYVKQKREAQLKVLNEIFVDAPTIT